MFRESASSQNRRDADGQSCDWPERSSGFSEKISTKLGLQLPEGLIGLAIILRRLGLDPRRLVQVCRVYINHCRRNGPRPPSIFCISQPSHMSDSASSRPLAPAPGLHDFHNAPDDVNPARKHKTTACRRCKQKKLKVWIPSRPWTP